MRLFVTLAMVLARLLSKPSDIRLLLLAFNSHGYLNLSFVFECNISLKNPNSAVLVYSSSSNRPCNIPLEHECLVRKFSSNKRAS